VEHSVTEAVWGVDLVRAQILVAQGKKLSEIFPFVPSPRGHAIQARIYAEDSSNQFAPSPGTLALVEWPQAIGCRVDTGVQTGSTIGLDYDAMIAKLTVNAADRPAALARMLWCLRHTVLFGTITNVNFLQDILAHPKVAEGKMHIKLLEKEFGGWTDAPPPEALEIQPESAVAPGSEKQRAASPWERA
jgi:propionyl-CoA carboxylase alpha chain